MGSPRLDSAVMTRPGVRMESYLDRKAHKYVTTIEVDVDTPSSISVPHAVGLLRNYANVMEAHLKERQAANE